MDSGIWLRNEIKKHCKEADVKYIDPSYMIRSVPTISADRIYCKARSRWGVADLRGLVSMSVSSLCRLACVLMAGEVELTVACCPSCTPSPGQAVRSPALATLIASARDRP